MQSLKRFVLPVLAIFILVVIMYWLAGGFKDKISPNNLGERSTTRPQEPQSIILRWQEIEVSESVPGSVNARDATLISSQILARIAQIHVRPGDLVVPGDLLISLENSALLAYVQQAKALVESLKAQTTEAQNTQQRIQALREQNLASVSELDRAHSQYQQLHSQLIAAQQRQQVAETELAYSVIRSPIAGRVINRFAEPGDMASPSLPLLTLYNPSSLQIEANVRESVAVTLTLGQSVQVTLGALNKTSKATITEMVPAADTASRSFIVKAQLEMNDERLPGMLPGMYASMEIPLRNEQKLLIPIAYVQRTGQLELVWVQGAEQLQRRYIRTTIFDDHQLEVISGLQQNEIVVKPQ